VYFYELHEGDEDVFSDVLLASDEEMAAEDFFDLVQSVRRQVQDSHGSDTLIEAIAQELERSHGFQFISDERLHAAVSVSTVEEENLLISVDDETARADYKAVFAEYADEDRDEDEDEDRND